MANYVVLARFDDKTTMKLSSLREKLYEESMKMFSEWMPHITIAAYENVDIQALLQWTAEFAKKHTAFDISLSSLGILPPDSDHPETAVIYASPAPSKKFIEFYYAFHERLDDFCGNPGWKYSARCANPIAFHSTIGIFEIGKIQKAMEVIFAHQIFEIAKIVALEVYTYPMELIQRFELDNGIAEL